MRFARSAGGCRPRLLGDGLEVGGEFAQQPEHFDVAVTFGLQQPGGTHPMQITVEVKLEQRRRGVRRPARAGADGPGKAQRVQVERADEGIKKAHGVFGGDVILQPFGKEQGLGPVQAGTMIHA
jgi:hypothetical protein